MKLEIEIEIEIDRYTTDSSHTVHFSLCFVAPRRTKFHSHHIISHHITRITLNTQNRLDEECAQLLVDIRRIGVDGEPNTTFGELFDDENVSNYYEALVGTLKAAKKRKMITFQGQLLLKGVSDKVKISIIEE